MSEKVPGKNVRQIVKMLKARDEDGLRLWLKWIAPRVRGALVRRFERPQDDPLILDALSRTAESVWYKISSFDENRMKNFEGWCLRIANRHCLDRFRSDSRFKSRHRSTELMDELAALETPHEIHHAEDLDNRKRLAEAMWSEIERLPQTERAIILADLKADGIAEAVALANALRISKGSVYPLRYRARRRLRGQLIEKGIYPTTLGAQA